MHVDDMTENGYVSFSKECKSLLGICDEIGTKGDKKYAKHEAKPRLKHKYYWVHKKEDIIFNGMKAVYKILNNQDKVIMKHFYNIRCNPYLDKGFCEMQQIICACTGCVEQLSNNWLPKLDITLQPFYAIEPKTCRYYSILRGYDKWYIEKLT